MYIGDGQGNFKWLEKGPEAESLGEKSFWNVVSVDLDGDNRKDIIASSLDSLGLLAWLNKGENSWEQFDGHFRLPGFIMG